MKKTILAAMGLAATIAYAPSAVASMSSVQRAAIEKMQSKLGAIRGSIEPNNHNIFLTIDMIERLKPIRPGDFAPKPQGPPMADQTPSDTAGLADAVSHEVFANTTGSLPNTDDMDAIMEALDKRASQPQ